MDTASFRILDANLNRAREALRVVEDHARFALDDGALCGDLKQLRHELAAETDAPAREAILHRDTPHDAGTANKTGAEMHRTDADHVVVAAGKRLGEALRTIEECLKIDHPPAASAVESIRYRFYAIEQRVYLRLRPRSFDRVRLCVLITESLCRRPWLEVTEAAIASGADCIQLREKELDSGELLRRAGQLVDLCRRRGVISIINDRPDVAVMSGADGVHVGQGDLPCREVRKLVGSSMIVGVSTHNLEQALAAQRDGADYIGVGPVFPSKTKPREILPGLDYARAAAAAVKIPCVAIAGISPENAADVMATGVRALAASSAVIAAVDVTLAVVSLKKQMQQVAKTF